MADLVTLLVAVVGGFFWVVKRYAEQRDAAQPERARGDIDATLASGNPAGISQLLDRLFERSKDRHSS